ncbi:MAG: hypothetical protein IGS39_24585 [Calothrix sp. C42_A2020_038]|nr:hypothetical protein [Calothrix sp. C42_A2020_038]
MRIKPIYLSLVASAIVLSYLFSASISAQTLRINSVATIISDMKPPHDAAPRGVPKHYSWVKGPELGMGNDPKNFRAMIAWGQLYEAEQGNPASNTRVQIRNIRTYILSKRTRRWRLLKSSVGVDGAAYREDFAGDANKPPDIRQERDGSVSVKAGGGYNYHFWTKNGRSLINPNDIGGIFTTCQARLVVDNPRKPDDRAKAKYILNMGGDYWLDLAAPWDHFKTNGGIGMGRFKYVRNRWQAFNMTTLPEAQIRRNPPPIS